MVLLASDFDKSKYLKAETFKGEQKFRIKTVTAEDVGVGDAKERKLIVWFTNDEHGLILNRTNNRTLREAFGDDTEGWVRKIIVIYPTMVDMRGKQTKALRITIPPPKQASQATAPASAAPSGNGASAPTGGNGAAPTPTAAPEAAAPGPVAPEVDDPELVNEPRKPPADEMDDAIPF
jgi:hypothetical protein